MTSFVMPQATFVDLMTRAAMFAIRDDSLPVLGCIKIESARGWITFTATDRYKAGCFRYRPSEPVESFTFLYPVTAMPYVKVFTPSKKSPNALVGLAIDGDAIRLTGQVKLGRTETAGASFNITGARGEYPKLGRIWSHLRRAPANLLTTVDPNQLTVALKALRNPKLGVTFWVSSEHLSSERPGPITLRSVDGSGVALVMPLRDGSECPQSDPAWAETLGLDA